MLKGPLGSIQVPLDPDYALVTPFAPCPSRGLYTPLDLLYAFIYPFIHSLGFALLYLSVVLLNNIPSCLRPFIFLNFLVNKIIALNNKKKEKREWKPTIGEDHGREGGHSMTQTPMKVPSVLLVLDLSGLEVILAEILHTVK